MTQLGCVEYFSLLVRGHNATYSHSSHVTHRLPCETTWLLTIKFCLNGMYFASYDYLVAGRSNMTIYAHQVATLGSISYSEVPLSSSTVVSTHIPQTQVPCQLDCMQSTSSVILQPSTFMLNTGNAVSTRRLGKLQYCSTTSF